MSFIAEFLASRFVGVRGGISLNRGARALAAGKAEEAVRHFEDAVEAKTAAMGTAKHPVVGRALTELAAAHRLNKDSDKAAAALVDAVEIFQEQMPTDPETAITMNNLAVMLRNSGQHVQARAVFGEALRLMREKIYPDNPLHHDLAAVAVNAARNELASGTGARGVFAAEEALRGAVRLRKQALGLVPCYSPSEEELTRYSDFENNLRPPFTEDMSDMGLTPVTDEILATALRWHAEALLAQHALIQDDADAAAEGNGRSKNAPLESGNGEDDAFIASVTLGSRHVGGSSNDGSSTSSPQSSSSMSLDSVERSMGILTEAQSSLEEAIAITECIRGPKPNVTAGETQEDQDSGNSDNPAVSSGGGKVTEQKSSKMMPGTKQQIDDEMRTRLNMVMAELRKVQERSKRI